MQQKEWNAVGMMSGTSLDGLDLAHVRFWKVNESWHYALDHAETVPYDTEWEKKLRSSMKLSGQELRLLDLLMGKYFGEKAKDFIRKHNLQPDLIASHGHTVFHQPELNMTYQIGDGTALRLASGQTVINDFRTEDVLKDGQGAPLVPIGDLLLFKKYRYCLNIGGIANISIKQNTSIEAADICFANMALNELAQERNMAYDEDGKLAAKGKVNTALLSQLESTLKNINSAFSLGRENYEKEFLPLIKKKDISVEDRAATCCQYIARAISRRVEKESAGGEMLITGGGAFHRHLIATLAAELDNHCEIVVPESELVSFKEALIFAFLGVLRLEGQINVLASVTGATGDSCSGTVYR